MNLRKVLIGITAILLISCNSPKTDSSKVSIVFLGDTHLGENYRENWDYDFLQNFGYDYSFQFYKDFLNSKDLVIANLETPVTDLNSSPFEGQKNYLHFTDTKKTPETLINYNIKTVSLANNHTLDFGEEGLRETFHNLSNFGINYFGAGMNLEEASQPLIHNFPDLDRQLVVFAGFEYRQNYDQDYNFYAGKLIPGVNSLSSKKIINQIEDIRNDFPNAFIVIYPHWGQNYKFKTPEQRDLAHQFIDSGADLIVGHGAHMLQEVENYKDKWIVYSLGNFVFNSPGRYQSNNAPPYSAILELQLTKDSYYLNLYPILSDNKKTNYQSRFLLDDEIVDMQLIYGINGIPVLSY